MTPQTLAILAGNPEIDKIMSILVESMHRAAAETQHGKVELSVPILDGKFHKPKVVRITYHNL